VSAPIDDPAHAAAHDAAVLLEVLAVASASLAVRVARTHRSPDWVRDQPDTRVKLRGTDRITPVYPVLPVMYPTVAQAPPGDTDELASRLRAAATLTVELVTAHAEAAAECAAFATTGVLDARAAAYLLATLWLAERTWGDPGVELCARWASHAALVDQIDHVLDRATTGLAEQPASVARVLLVEQPFLSLADVRAAAVAACR
jgi:hypothetical protein